LRKKAVSKILKSIIIVLMLVSIGYSIFTTIKYLELQQMYYSINIRKLEFDNANSRDTYFTMHNIKAAHELSTGKGIKIGILDWNFGYDTENSLYTSIEKFTDTPLNEAKEHGFQMAKVLREVAPDCRIYALNVMSFGQTEEEKAAAIIQAIDWAIDAGIDILTYSGSRFSEKNEALLDEAINRAVESGIVTTFIHCPNENNLLPTYLSTKDAEYDGREADVNIFGLDYNTLYIDLYQKAMSEETFSTQKKDEVMFGSASSTSPVAAGFVALLMELDPGLKPQEYKEILVKTSRSLQYNGQEAPVVPDIYKALIELKERG
jgi:hypothetical protein